MMNLVWFPPALGIADRALDKIDCRVVAVRRDFIANEMSDCFLGIQFRVIRGQVLHLDFRVVDHKISHLAALVPRRAVDVRVDLPALDPLAQVLEEREKTLSVSFGPTEESMPTIERFDPAEKVQPLVVLTRRRDDRLSPAPRPDSTELRMQREPAFVRKH